MDLIGNTALEFKGINFSENKMLLLTFQFLNFVLYKGFVIVTELGKFASSL